jgi:hypothetical protein
MPANPTQPEEEDRRMARCETCGAELQDASQRFCGGDRCHRVFMKTQTRHAGDFTVHAGAAFSRRFALGTRESRAAISP